MGKLRQREGRCPAQGDIVAGKHPSRFEAVLYLSEKLLKGLELWTCHNFPSMLCVLTHILEQICSLPGAKIQPSCTDTGILHRGFTDNI